MQCLGGMADGPCGEDFKSAFSCFIYSEAEPKGMDCVDKFKAMQDCFRKHPEIYGEGEWGCSSSCVLFRALFSPRYYPWTGHLPSSHRDVAQFRRLGAKGGLACHLPVQDCHHRDVTTADTAEIDDDSEPVGEGAAYAKDNNLPTDETNVPKPPNKDPPPNSPILAVTPETTPSKGKWISIHPCRLLAHIPVPVIFGLHSASPKQQLTRQERPKYSQRLVERIRAD